MSRQPSLGHPATLRFAAGLALAALAALLPTAALAAVLSCTVSTAAVAFGTYTPLQAAPLAGTGAVNTVCTVNSHTNTLTIALSTGNSASFATRQLKTTVGVTTYTLNYNLYQNPADTTIWGDGSSASYPTLNVTLTRHGNVNTITTSTPVYGAVGAAQDPAPGTYADTITVTVNF
jgi:spore coat protein U domain-containing protein, fimbrial subunit CupE1/2/3/6